MPLNRSASGVPLIDIWEQLLREISDGDLIETSCGPSKLYTLFAHSNPTLVVGMNPGINTTLTETICRDKALTCTALSTRDIPVVDYAFIASTRLPKFKRTESVWQTAISFFGKCGGSVVVKPNRGARGDLVYKCVTKSAMEAAITKISSTFQSIMLSEYIPATCEIRVMISTTAEGMTVPRVSFMIVKEPLKVIGDGVSSLRKLFLDAPAALFTDVNDVVHDLADTTDGLDFDTVLAKGKEFQSWKNNEGKGAKFTHIFDWTVDQVLRDTVINKQDLSRVEELALSTSRILGLRFGAVDILLPSFYVLEVNTSVMFDFLELPIETARMEIRSMLEARKLLERRFVARETIAPHLPLSVKKCSSDRPTNYNEKASLKLSVLRMIAEHFECAVEDSDSSFFVRLTSREVETISKQSFRRCYNVNYDFGITLSGSGDITFRKTLTYLALNAACVSSVPHYLLGFPPSGALSALHKLVSDSITSFPVVVKQDNGSSGQRCAIARDLIEAETLILLWSDFPLCVSPFLKIVQELRFVVLGGSPLVTYSKDRPTVVADGQHTTIELLVHDAKANGRQKFLQKWLTETEISGDFFDIPAAGTQIPVCWKHNLDFGADPHILLMNETPPKALCLALAACEALHAFYAAVDVVEFCIDGRLEWAVLEVNSSPAWNHLLVSHSDVALQCLATIVWQALELQLT